MANKEVVLNFKAKVNTDVKEVKKILTSLESQMGELTIPEANFKTFKNTLEKINKELLNFESLIEKGSDNLADTKKIEKSWSKVTDLLFNVQSQLKNMGSEVDIFPRAVLDNISKATSLLDNYNKKLKQIRESEEYTAKAAELSDRKEYSKQLKRSVQEAQNKAQRKKATAIAKEQSWHEHESEYNEKINEREKKIAEKEREKKTLDQLKKEREESGLFTSQNKVSKLKTSQRVEKAKKVIQGDEKKEIQGTESTFTKAQEEFQIAKKQASVAKGLVTKYQKKSKKNEAQLKKDQDYLQLVDNYNKKLKKQEELYDNLVIAENKHKQALEELSIAEQETNKASRIENSIEDSQNKIANLDKDIKEIDEYIDRLERLQKANADAKREFTEANSELETATSDYNKCEQAVESLSSELKQMEIDQSTKEWEELVKIIEEITGIDLTPFAGDINKVVEALEKYKIDEIEKTPSVVSQTKTAFKELRPAIDGVADATDELNDTLHETERRSKEIEQVKDTLLDIFSMGNTIDLFRDSIQHAFETVKELDAAMTETAVVTDFSVGDMWDKLPEYTEQASALGVKVVDLYKATTLYYQQGLDSNQAMGLGVETLKMAKIANMEAAEATQAMTAALRGFNMEINQTNAEHINDVYSKLAAITAADTSQIATAMSKTASLAASANMDFETTAAFLAQIIETTQEAPETAGTALKTIIARFAEVKELKEQGLTIGTDEEGEELEVNKIADALKSVGISMNGFFAGTEGLDSIFLKLSSRWDSLDFKTQRYIATVAAGSRMQSRFMAMMSDHERVIELVNEAYDSGGASAEQYAKTQESLQSILNRLQNAWDQFAMGLANSEVIKKFLIMLTTFLEKINAFNIELEGKGIDKFFTSIAEMAIALIGGGKALRMLFSIMAKFFKKGFDSKGIFGSFFKGTAGLSIDWKKILIEIFDGKGLSKETIEQIIKQAVPDDIGGNIATDIGEKIIKSGKGKIDLSSILLNLINFSKGKDAQLLKQSLSNLSADELIKYLTNMEIGRKNINADQAIGFAKQLTDSLNLGDIGIDDIIETIMYKKGFGSVGGKVAGGKIASIFSKISSSKIVTSIFSKISSSKIIASLTSLVSKIPGGVWVIAAIAAAAGLAILWKTLGDGEDSIKSLEKSIKSSKEQLALEEEELERLKEEANNSQVKIDNLNLLKEKISELTEGTKEWKEALLESNEQVLELIEKYPYLKNYLQKGEYGQLELSEQGEVFLSEVQSEEIKNQEDKISEVEDKITKEEEKILLKEILSTPIKFDSQNLEEAVLEGINKGLYSYLTKGYMDSDSMNAINSLEESTPVQSSKAVLGILGLTDEAFLDMVALWAENGLTFSTMTDNSEEFNKAMEISKDILTEYGIEEEKIIKILELLGERVFLVAEQIDAFGIKIATGRGVTGESEVTNENIEKGEFNSNLLSVEEIKELNAKTEDIEQARWAGGLQKTEESQQEATSSEVVEDWDNNYDKLYNLINKIKTEQSQRQRIEKRYEALLRDIGTSAKDLYKANIDQLIVLEKEKQLQQNLIANRKKQISLYQQENSNLSGYAQVNQNEYGKIALNINWQAIEAVKDQDLGNQIQTYVSQLEEWQESIEQAEEALWDIENSVKEIEERGQEEYIELENTIKDAIISSRQEEIDKLTNIDDSINDTNNKILSSIQDYFNKQRKQRANEKTEQDIQGKERRLLYLQRDSSSAHNLEIQQLREELEQDKEDYTDTLIDQKIEELQKQNDLASEQRQFQIEIMQNQLEQYEKSGEIWQEVNDLIKEGLDEETGLIRGSKLESLLKESVGFDGMSKIQQMEWLEELENSSAQALSYLNLTNDRLNQVTGKLDSAIDKLGNIQANTENLYGNSGGNMYKNTGGYLSGGQVNNLTGNSELTDEEIEAILKEQAAIDEKYKQQQAMEEFNNNINNNKDRDKEKEKEKEKDRNNNSKNSTIYLARVPPTRYNASKLFRGSDLNKLEKEVSEYIFSEYEKNFPIDFTRDLESQFLQRDLEITRLIKDIKYTPETVFGFKHGGLADFTGPAWLDGTKSKPEYVLNASQTKSFFKLINVLDSFKDYSNSLPTQNIGGNVYDIDINIETVKEEADIDKLTQKIQKSIVSASQYRSNTIVKR